jgi:hypothetical protein
MAHFYLHIFKNVLQVLFSLFDHQSKGQLVLSDFIESLKEKLGYALAHSFCTKIELCLKLSHFCNQSRRN